MRRLVGARDTHVLRAGNEQGCVQTREAAELLVDAVCVGRRERQVVSTCNFLPLA